MRQATGILDFHTSCQGLLEITREVAAWTDAQGTSHTRTVTLVAGPVQ